MRILFLFSILVCVAGVWLGIFLGVSVVADYDYSNRIGSYWDLSVKASTIQQKSEYLDKYISAIESADLADNDAIFLKTPDTNTRENIKALKSLQVRMHEIFEMDVNSFQYQQAISQITAQEQDDAKAVLGRIEGAWYLKHHFFLWEWVGAIQLIFVLLFGLAAIIGLIVAWADY